MMKFYVSIAVATFIAATPALALEVTTTKDSKVTADALWSAVGKFCDIPNWHPAIVRCVESKEGQDTFRTLSLDGGGEVYEKKVSFDEAGKAYSYMIEKSPLPVKNYSAKIAVTSKDEGSAVTWSATFDAKDATDEKAIETILGIFESGLTSLVESLNK